VQSLLTSFSQQTDGRRIGGAYAAYEPGGIVVTSRRNVESHVPEYLEAPTVNLPQK
jgi:hypothetical protein